MIYAGFWQRFFAQIIDVCIIFMAVILIVLFFGFIAGLSGYSLSQAEILEESATYSNYVFYLVSFLYQSFFLASSSMATPGRMALGIVVTDMSGKGLSLSLAFWRSFLSVVLINAPLDMISLIEQDASEEFIIALYSAYFICFLFIILMQLFTAKRQTLYDLVVGTVVIIKPVGSIHASSPATESIKPILENRLNHVFFGFDSKGYIIRHTIDVTNQKLVNQGIFIGRDESKCDFILADNSVSRIHAKLTSHSSELYLEDFNSTNQTKVNGNVLPAGIATKICHGDVISLGDVELTLNS